MRFTRKNRKGKIDTYAESSCGKYRIAITQNGSVEKYSAFYIGKAPHNILGVSTDLKQVKKLCSDHEKAFNQIEDRRA